MTINDTLTTQPKHKSQPCLLCNTTFSNQFHQDPQRDYFRCPTCNLIFVPPGQYLSSEDEKSRYDLHKNNPDDQAYRRFLSRLFTPMQARIAPRSLGLDFGAGPGPTLSVMFEERGHVMEVYDYFYARNPALLEKNYDFITASEVVEHLHNPRRELDRLWGCLKPGGYLGLMTKLALGRQAFARWHYKNDPTHVCFFSQTTFAWLAVQWRAEVTFADKDVILLYKHAKKRQSC